MGKLWNCCVVECLYLPGMLCNPFRVNCQWWRRICSSFSLFASAFSTAASSFLWAFWVTWQWSHLCSFLSIGCRCWNQCKHQIPHWWYHRQLPHKKANLQLKKPFKLERQYPKQKTAVETHHVDHGHAQIACKGFGKTETQTDRNRDKEPERCVWMRTERRLEPLSASRRQPQTSPSSYPFVLLPTFFSFSVRRLSFLAVTNPQEYLQHLVATYCICVFTQEKTTLLVLCTSAHLRHHHAIKSSSTKTLKHNSPVHQNLRQISLSLCNKTNICKMLDSSQTIFLNRSPKTGFLSWQNNTNTHNNNNFFLLLRLGQISSPPPLSLNPKG